MNNGNGFSTIVKFKSFWDCSGALFFKEKFRIFMLFSMLIKDQIDFQYKLSLNYQTRLIK